MEMRRGAPRILLLLVVTTAVILSCGWASGGRLIRVGEGRGRKLASSAEKKNTTTNSFTTYGSWGFAYTRSRGSCSAEFWSSRKEEWPTMVPLTSSVAKIFGSQSMERYRPDLTLMEAAEKSIDSADAYGRLLKQSTAALLNSYSKKGYPYAAWEIKTLFLQALVSDEAASGMADRFTKANHVCD